MCTRFISPEAAEVERLWHIGADQPWSGAKVFPRQTGLFLRGGKAPGALDMVIGQFGLIPWFAKQAHLPYATQNARSEEMRNKASFKQAWAKGQRCLIPAASFDEPGWKTGRCVWHSFKRLDGAPWGLAGLWNTWIDKSTGELVESFTMLTINADQHPIMKHMHKPDPRLGPDKQDKRSVIAIERDQVEQWVCGSEEQAELLLQLSNPALFVVES